MLPATISNGDTIKSLEGDFTLKSDSIKALQDVFIAALTPLISLVQNISDFVQKSMEANIDSQLENETEAARGKVEVDAEGAKVDSGFNPLAIAGIGLLAGVLVMFKDKIQGVVNTLKFPSIIKGLSTVLKIFTLGFVNLTAKFQQMKLMAGLGKGGPVFGFISRLGQITTKVGKLFSFLKPIGNALGKLFIPITVVYGIIDAVQGFIKGYQDGGFIDGILTAIGSVLGGLIGMPLDFLKNILAFVAEKLGFDQVAEAMKDFSFNELIENVFGGIVDFFKAIPGFIKKIAQNFLRAIPGGDFLADKLFGKDSDTEIEKREKVQSEAQSDIDDADKKLANIQAREDVLMKDGGMKGFDPQFAKAKSRAEKQKLAAEDKMSKAAQESLALKEQSAGKDIGTQIAAGKITNIDEYEQAVGTKLTEKEKSFAMSKIGSARDLVADKESADFSQDLADDVLGTTSRKRGQDEFNIDTAKTMAGMDPNAPGTFDMTMKEGKIESIADKKVQPTGSLAEGGPPPIIVGGSSSGGNDNSQTSNDNRSFNNSTTHNYGGGSDSASNSEESLARNTSYAANI